MLLGSYRCLSSSRGTRPGRGHGLTDRCRGIRATMRMRRRDPPWESPRRSRSAGDAGPTGMIPTGRDAALVASFPLVSVTVSRVERLRKDEDVVEGIADPELLCSVVGDRERASDASDGEILEVLLVECLALGHGDVADEVPPGARSGS